MKQGWSWVTRRTMRVFVCFVVLLCVSALQVACQATMTPAGSVGDFQCVEEENQDGSEPIVVCRFEVSKNKITEEQQSSFSLPKACIDRSDLCFEGTVRASIMINSQESETKSEDTAQETERITPEKREKSDILHVGKASYRPPNEQHGARVAEVLHRAPEYAMVPNALETVEELMELANWHYDLGVAHFPTAEESQDILLNNYEERTPQQQEQNENFWVQVELAINAFRQALRLVEDTGAIEPIASLQNKIHNTVKFEFLASVHFQLGEAYYLDPEFKWIDQACNSYQEAQKFYESLLKDQNLDSPFLDMLSLKERYARACVKVGMAITAKLQSSDQDFSSWASSRMMGSMGSKAGQNSDNAEAEKAFQKAMTVYEELFRDRDQYSDSDAEWVDIEVDYISALQHTASAILVSGDIPKAKEYLSKAVGMTEDLLSKDGYLDGYRKVHAQTSLADCYQSLSDACTQLGQYTCAKDSYRRSMEVHSMYSVAVSPFEQMDASAEEQLETLLDEAIKMLEAYRSGEGISMGPDDEMLGGNPYTSGDVYYMQQNDGFEGDLLASVGSIYLTMGESESAISYFVQARDKYSKSEEDKVSPAMADLLVNLAMAYYQRRRFDESTESQLAALDIYRGIYGDGVNPYTQGMMELNEMLEQQLGGSFGGQNGFPGSRQGTSYQNKATQSSSAENDQAKATASDTQSTSSTKIDLKHYQMSLQNVTELLRDQGVDTTKQEL